LIGPVAATKKPRGSCPGASLFRQSCANQYFAMTGPPKR
jgi:hypothetical protein